MAKHDFDIATIKAIKAIKAVNAIKVGLMEDNKSKERTK